MVGRKVLLLVVVLIGVLVWSGVGYGADANSVSELLKQAGNYQRGRQYSVAEGMYKGILAGDASDDKRIEAQVGLITLYIDQKKAEQAEAAHAAMLADFAGNAGLAKAVDHVADRYRKHKNYAKARELYEYAVDTWPGAEHAIDSQGSVILTSAQLGDDAGVSAGVERLMTGFSDANGVARITKWVCAQCAKAKAFSAAREVCEEYSKVRGNDEGAVWIQMAAAATSVALGDEEGMEGALSKLGTDFADVMVERKIGAAYGDFCRYLLRYRSENKDDVEEVIRKKILRDFMEDNGAVVVLDHMGDIYRDRREYDKAAELFRLVADGWHGEQRAIEAQANMVRMYIDKADDANSQATFDELMRKFGDDERIGWGVWYVAERYWDFGSMDKAVEKYKYVVEHWPTCERGIWANMRQVMARVRLKDVNTAEIELGQMLRRYAGNKDLGATIHEVVEEYRNAGLYEEGRGLFAWLIENWDEGAGTMLELQVGIALESIRLGEFDKAETATAKLIADYNDHPNIAKGLFQIGEEYFYRHGYRESIRLLELIRSDYPELDFPDKEQAPFVLATCYRRVEDYNNAIAYYEAAVEEYPKGKFAERAPYWVGVLYRDKLKDYSNALEWFGKEVEFYPESGFAKWSISGMGMIYFMELGDYSKAAEYFEDYIAKYPKGGDVWSCYGCLADSYVKLGEREKAMAVLQTAYVESPSENLRGEFMERIAKLEKGGAK